MGRNDEIEHMVNLYGDLLNHLQVDNILALNLDAIQANRSAIY